MVMEGDGGGGGRVVCCARLQFFKLVGKQRWQGFSPDLSALHRDVLYNLRPDMTQS